MSQSKNANFSSQSTSKALPYGMPKANYALRAAFMLFLIAMPFEQVTLPFAIGLFSLAKLAGLLLAATALVQFDVCFRQMPKAVWWFGIYLVVFGVSALIGDPQVLTIALIRASQLIQLVVLFIICYNLFRSTRMMESAVKTIIYSTAAVSILELVGIGRNADAAELGRDAAFSQNLNTWGTVIAVALILIMGLLLNPVTKSNRKIMILLFVIMGVELLRTSSRSAMVGCLGGGMLFLLQGRRLTQKLKIWTITGCAVLFLVAGAYEFESARWAVVEQGNLAGRQQIYPAAWQMFLERPLFGWGPATNVLMLGAKLGYFARDTHNLPLWLLTEVGIVGATPFLIGWTLCVVFAWKGRNGPFGMTPLAANVCFLYANQGHTFHTLKLFWIVLAMGAACGTHLTYIGEIEPQRAGWRRFSWRTGADA